MKKERRNDKSRTPKTARRSSSSSNSNSIRSTTTMTTSTTTTTGAPSSSSSLLQQQQQQRRQQQENEQQPNAAGANDTIDDNSNAVYYYTTRLCLKNLPASFTSSDQVRAFVLQNVAKKNVPTTSRTPDHDFTITDCRLLRQRRNNNNKDKDGRSPTSSQSRRMAFLGLATPAQAAAVRDALHRTYCQTSRLMVEYAHRPTGLLRNTNNQEDKYQQQDTSVSDKNEKEQHPREEQITTNVQEEEEQRRKKEEFLAVMGVGGGAAAVSSSEKSSHKNKFWANDHHHAPQQDAATMKHAVAMSQQQQQQELSRRHQDHAESASDDDDSSSSSTSSSSSSSSSTTASLLLDSSDDDDDDNADPLLERQRQQQQQKQQQLADLEFFKSKQVSGHNLEDLKQDDDNDSDDVSTRSSRSNDMDDDSDDSNDSDTSERNIKNSSKDKDNGSEDSSTDSSSDSSDDDDDDDKHNSDYDKRSQLVNTSQDDDTQTHPLNETNHKSTEQTMNPKPSLQSATTSISNRLFLRNLPFSATEQDIVKLFERYGSVLDCHLPVDDQKQSKGFGFVTLAAPKQAQAAQTALDGTDFQGRLLHVLPARPPPTLHHEENDNTRGHLGLSSYQQRQEQTRQEQAGKEQTGWSASFVRGDAVVDTLADRLGLRKGDILAVKDGLSSGDAAVRLALGETAVIEENRKYFTEHGIDMEALVSFHRDNDKNKKEDSVDMERSKTCILVKNLPATTAKEELLKVFGSAGETPMQILLPPSRTIAVVEYSHGNDAKRAFRRLAYRRFKSVPLYLEWAPLAARVETTKLNSQNKIDIKDPSKLEIGNDDAEHIVDVATGPTSTVYVKNLSFSTTEDTLREVFAKQVNDVRAVRIPKKVAPIKRVRGAGDDTLLHEDVRKLSMGYGFVEFGSQQSARKVLKTLQGTIVEGHALELKPSNKNPNAKSDSLVTRKNPSKLLVRNVPFQATRKELLQLFGSFGQLKRVRLPKKFDGTHRGFAFIEYLTGKEAAAAMKSLSRTHLYGRHLVIEWAASDEEADNMQELHDKAHREAEKVQPKNKKIRFD